MTSNFPPGCGLAIYEVPSTNPGISSLKGLLMEKAIGICQQCLGTRFVENQFICHPIITTFTPDIPTPFLVVLDEAPLEVQVEP